MCVCEDPIAMKVAPATSGFSFSFSEIMVSEGSKYLSGVRVRVRVRARGQGWG